MAEDSDTLHRAPTSPFFLAWAEVVIRFRWPLLAVFAVITLVGLHQGVTRLVIDNSFDSFLASDSIPALMLEELRDDFGNDVAFEILIEGDVFSLDYLNRLKKLHDELANLSMEIDSLGYRRNRGTDKNAKKPDGEEDEDEDKDKDGERDGEEGKKADALEGFEDSAGGGDDEFAEFEGGSSPGDDGFEDVSGDDDGWGEEGGANVVDHIMSLINVRDTRWEGGGMRVGELLADWPTAEQLPALKKRLLNPENRVGPLGYVLGKGGQHSIILLRTEFMHEKDLGRVFDELLKITKKHETEGFHILIGGLPALAASLNAKMLDDFLWMGMAALFVMLVILLSIFRHPWGVAGPLLGVWQAAVWTVGLMAAREVSMTIVTNVLPVFLFCVGLAASIHIQSVYRDARKKGMDNHKAIVHAVGVTGIPVFYTTLTTCIGLASFSLASLQAIRDLGLFGSFGVAVSLLQTLVIVPIMLTFNKKSLLGVSAKPGKRDLLDRFLAMCNLVSHPRQVGERVSNAPRYITLSVASLLLVASVYGASLLGVSQNPIKWLPSDDQTVKAFRSMDRHMGGSSKSILLVEALGEKGLKDRDLMLRLQRLERHIQSYRDPATGQVITGDMLSLLDVMRETWKAVNGSKQEFYKVPGTERGVVDMLTLFESSSPDELKQLATLDMKKCMTTIRVQWQDATAYRPLSDHIDRGIPKIIGDQALIKPTGTLFNMVAVQSALLTDLMRSFGTAFVVIAITMIMLLRNAKLGLIAMVPNLLPIVTVMGFMGYVSIPLTISNLLIGSIAIGLAVDNTIHFMHQFRAHYALNGHVDAAIGHAFAHTGRAITATTTVLVAGFMVYNMAHLNNIRLFGQLEGLTLTLALLINLMFGPALLRTLYKTRPGARADAHD